MPTKDEKAADAVATAKEAERAKMDQPVRPWDIGKEGVKEKYGKSNPSRYK